MRAVRFEPNGSAHVVDIPHPLPSAGDVVIRVTSTSVCGSDLAALRGTHPFRVPPLISGHEAGGIVDAVGPGVTRVAVGDRVVVEPQRPCWACALCTEGRYHLCPKKQMLGIAEWDGSFADYVAVPEYTLLHAPSEIPNHALALAEPLAVACHAVRQVRGDVHGGRHLVLGGGAIGGLIAHVLAQADPAALVVSEPRESNHDMLHAMGATEVRPRLDGLVERAGRFDTVFIAAGVPALAKEAFRHVESGGSIIQVAVFNIDVPIPAGELQVREIAFNGTAMYTREDFERALELLAIDADTPQRIVSRRVDLEEGAQIITDMVADGPGDIIKLLMEPR